MSDTSAESSLEPQPRLLNSTMVMASGTFVSRILGLVRVALLGYLLGNGSRQADMLSIASGVPGQLYMLLVGGVLDAILVPLLVKARTKDADGGQAFTDRIVTLFLILVSALTVIFTIATPVVVYLQSDAAWRAPENSAQYHSLLILTAVCLPQVFFYGVFYLAGQILNSRNCFGPMMWAPVANNIIQIALLGVYAVVWGFHDAADTSGPFTTAQILVLGLGTLVSVAIQTVILLPYLKKVGFRYTPRFDFLHTGLGSTAHLAKWMIAMVVIDQAYYWFNTRLASKATAGGNGAGATALGNAALISLLPHALLTVSLATALLPSLSKLAAAKSWNQFADQFSSGLKIVFAAIVPVSLLVAALGLPIATLIWSPDVGGNYVGWTLTTLSVGMIPYTLMFLVFRGFYALGNTRVPFFSDVIFVLLTCGVGAILIYWVNVPPAWVAPNIGIARFIGNLAAGAFAWIFLRTVVPALSRTHILARTVHLVVISIPGAVLAWVICWYQKAHFTGFVANFLGLAVAGCVGVLVYVGLARLTRVTEITEVLTLLRSKLKRSSV